MSKNNKYHNKLKKVKNEKELYKYANKAIADYKDGFFESSKIKIKKYFKWKINQVNDLFNEKQKQLNK